MPDNNTLLSSQQEDQDDEPPHIVLSTDRGMSVYSLSGLDEITNNPDDRLCISRLNQIRKGTHDDVDDQTGDIEELFGELGEQSRNWDIYGESEVKQGRLDDHKWLDWEDLASVLARVEGGKADDHGDQGSAVSNSNEPGVERTADTAGTSRAGSETPRGAIQVAESLEVPVIEDLADPTDGSAALKIDIRGKPEIPISVTHSEMEIDMPNAEAYEVEDEDMMDIDSDEDPDTFMSG